MTNSDLNFMILVVKILIVFMLIVILIRIRKRRKEFDKKIEIIQSKLRHEE